LTTASTATAFAVSVGATCKQLGCTTPQAQAGIALYAWGAGVMPLFVAPISEEFGRRPVYLGAMFVFWLFHIANAVWVQNIKMKGVTDTSERRTQRPCLYHVSSPVLLALWAPAW